MVAALGENFGPLVSMTVPKAGMFVWAEFPEGTDMQALEPVSQERGVRYLGGHQFSPTGEGSQRARLNYSFPTPGGNPGWYQPASQRDAGRGGLCRTSAPGLSDESANWGR